MQKRAKEIEDKKIQKMFKPNMERSTSTYTKIRRKEDGFFQRLKL